MADWKKNAERFSDTDKEMEKRFDAQGKLIPQQPDECRHIFGNMADWPRPCLTCGKDESAILTEDCAKVFTEKLSHMQKTRIAPDIQSRINIWSMRPRPGTPEGDAWEDGCRQGYVWGIGAASEPEREYSAEDKLCKAVGLLRALKGNPEHLSEPALRQITEALNEIEGEQS